MEPETLQRDVSLIAQSILPECGTKEATSLLLFYFYGRRHTASILGVSPNTVRDYVYRARKKLKQQCDIDDVEKLVIERILKEIYY